MGWIGQNRLSTGKNAVDVEQKGTTDVDVQCNLTVGVVHLIDLCMKNKVFYWFKLSSMYLISYLQCNRWLVTLVIFVCVL